MAERKQFTCNSFVFYGSFYEAISVLPAENQAHIYDAIFKFAFENIEVDLEGVELAVFLLIKPQLIANRARYENGCKGGRPRKEETETYPNEKQTTSESTYMQNQNKTEQKPNKNLTETKAKPNENDNDICLLSKLKNKLSSAGAYTGVHDALIDEVLTALIKGCELNGDITLNGEKYTAVQFERIANHLTVEQVAFVVNRLLNRRDEIQNRELYIMSVLASKYALPMEQ